jgi:hypothetical protein
MVVSLSIILLITFGGTLLTYLYEKEASLLVRVGAGNVIGSVIFGTFAFLLACFFGLSAATIFIGVLISLLPLILLKNKSIRQNFISNLRKARGKLEGATWRKFLSFTYYVVIFLILCLYFDRAMFENKDGLFTGGSQNLGDLPFHLGAIFSFTEGNNFPPQNPSFAGAKFTYPFLADLITACLVKLGSTVRDAMFFQNVTLGFSLVVLFERFTFALTKSKLAARLAPVIFLLIGGMGFVIFFRDYWQDGRGFFEFLRALSSDYTIRPETLRFGNPLIVLFMTQRGFLLGMPIVLIVLTQLWKVFATKSTVDTVEAEKKSLITHHSPFIILGLLAGTLPLIHVHSLFALFIICAFLLFFRLDKWREWIAFGVGVSLIAVPELVWSLTGSATNLSKFIGWHFGWDAGEENFFIFWIKNLGVFIPLLLVAIFLLFRQKEAEKNELQKANYELLKFYLPFAFIFLLSNMVKFAPWEWDNIKVLIYWFLVSVPLVAWLLAHLWAKDTFFKVIVALSLIILTFSGILDVWRVISKQVNYLVFTKDAVKIAEQIKQRVPPKTLFLNAPTYNTAVVLTGRLSLMRYTGHLSSYGIDYEPREKEVQRIYEGSALADSFLKKNNIEFVLVSPDEKNYMEQNNLILNDKFFEKYPKIAEVGEYKVYKVK